MKKIKYCLIAALLIGANDLQAQKILETPATTSPQFLSSLSHPDDHHRFVFTFKLIPAKAGTFGYNIFADGQLLLAQAVMPGKGNDLGFATRQDAERTAQHIIQLLENPATPPIISARELEEMHIH